MLVRLDARVAGVTPWIDLEPFDELIASWLVDPAAGRPAADAEIGLQVRGDAGQTGWLVLARFASGAWTSVPDQASAAAELAVDVVRLPTPGTAVRLRATGVTFARPALCATRGEPAPVPVGAAPSVDEIPLESISQHAYAALHPELDGGGRSWCSPTSLVMVLRRWGRRVEVPDVARAVYDPAYGGCGNWSFNVAYAASLGLDAVVARLPSLVSAAPLLRAGVPLVASIVVDPGGLPGFPLAEGTSGHLVVLAGITSDGDPVVCDPAAPAADGVRRVYPRTAFERAWLGGSRGTTYVVRPRDHVVPASPLW